MQLNMVQQFFHSKLLGRPLLKFIAHNNIRQASTRIKKDEFKEISIPVPWGHISGKWWGCQDVQPMVALHGIQDNAATFDKLVPLLQVKSLLAVELPGHGRSSYIPKGFLYQFIGAVGILRFIIRDHLKLTQPVELLGHSFGSAVCFLYSALYPDQVSKFISIDCGRHETVVPPNSLIANLKKTIEKTFQYEEKSVPPEYSYEELLEVYFKGQPYPLLKESCEVLLTRGMTTLDNGNVHLSRDVRLKVFDWGHLTLEDFLELAPKIKCDVLSIQAENGIVVRNNTKGEAFRKMVEDMIKNSPKSRHFDLMGRHYLHLDNAKPVANLINTFLSK